MKHHLKKTFDMFSPISKSFPNPAVQRHRNALREATHEDLLSGDSAGQLLSNQVMHLVNRAQLLDVQWLVQWGALEGGMYGNIVNI